MSSYASLCGILSCIQETKMNFLSNASVQNFRNRLLTWYGDHRKVMVESGHSQINFVVLWHTAFICLYADFDLLECAAGRDGTVTAEKAGLKARAWASSSEARRGTLHALLLLKQLEGFPVGIEPAIHVPKALFYSAIAIHCYAKFGPSANSFAPLQREINSPELQISNPITSLNNRSDHSSHIMFFPLDSSTLCSVINLLRRLGHWGISQKYISILETFLDNGDRACNQPLGPILQ
jgi:hypothetical protein